MRFWDFNRSPASARLMLDFGASRGLSRDALLAGADLSAAQLDDPNVEVTAAQELCVAANLVRLLKRAPELGFEVGSRYHFSAYGVWGYGLIASATARDALALALRFLPLTYVFTTIAYHEEGELACLTFGAPPLADAAVAQFLLARDMTAATVLLAETLGGEFALARFSMQGERPAAGGASDACVAGLGDTDVQFGACSNGFAFSRALLDRKLPQANPTTAAMCEQMCKRLLESRRVLVGTATMVRHYLSASPDAAPFSLEEAARLMNVSARTLRRRLHEEDTTFRALLDEARGALAETLLGDARLSLADIAERLRFSDLSSFSQAFKRWHGVAPRTYRAKLLRAAPRA